MMIHLHILLHIALYLAVATLLVHCTWHDVKCKSKVLPEP